jgi:ATP-binding cassette subfamily B protein
MAKRQKIKFNKELLDFSLIKRILKIVWDCSKGLTISRFILIGFQAILPLIPLYLMKLLLDAFATGQKPEFRYIVWVLVGFAAVKILSIIVSNVSSYVTMLHADVVADHMSNVVISKAIKTDMQYFDSDRYHDIFARAIGQSSSRPLTVLSTIMSLFQNLISLSAIAGLLFTLHWGIAIILFFVAIPAALIRWHFTEKTVELREQQTQRERRSGYLRGVLTGGGYAKELRVFDYGKVLLKQFLSLRTILRKEKRDLYWKQNATIGLAQSVEAVAIIAALGYIAVWAIRGLLSVGDIAMYYGAFQKGQSSINGLLKTFVSIHENKLFLGHLFEFLDLEPKILDDPTANPITKKIEVLEFDKVDFTYPETSKEILNNVSATFRKGEIIAIVGENGSGKTTAVKLINRLYEPTAGEIKVNGTNIRDLSLASYRKKLTVIFQHFSRYNASVTENIQYADVFQQLVPDHIKKASKSARASEFIERLPLKYQTQLGRSFRHGEELSGGQWQKIALSRAFYKNADIIVLDEPTSFIDPLAEEEIFNNLRSLTEDKILILITHRIYNLKIADKILVMDQGKIKEQGTHAELMAAKGLYAQMFESQA